MPLAGVTHHTHAVPTLSTSIRPQWAQAFVPLKHVSSNRTRYNRWTETRASAGEGAPASSFASPGFLATPNQQVPAFAALAVVHSGLAAATTLVPNWSLQNLLGLNPAPGLAQAATRGMLVVAGSYLWLMVACLVCLKDAAAHDRLGSDTYKRLALGVMYQSVIALVLFVRNQTLFTTNVLGVATGLFVSTALVAGRVYAVVNGSFSLPTIVKSFARSLLDAFKPRSISSSFYAVCAVLALLLFFWQFPTPGTPLFQIDCGPGAVFGKQARGAGMVLAGVVWYTLKDAADRGRLAATTFRQLNLAMAVVAALQLWAYWQISVAGVPLDETLWKGLIGSGLVTLAVCDFQFFFASRKES